MFFRAETFSAAQAILKGMFGYEEVYQYKLWEQIYSENLYFWYFVPAIAALIYLTPNAAELLRKYRPAIEFSYNFTRLTWLTRSIFNFLAWRPTLVWGVGFGVLALSSVVQIYRLDELTEFIYFNF